MFDKSLRKPNKINRQLRFQTNRRFAVKKFGVTVLALCLLGIPSGAMCSQVQTVEFTNGNCAITNEPVPATATVAHFESAYRLRLVEENRTHRWDGKASAVRIRGACESHVIWGYSDQIGLDSRQYVNFNKTFETADFRSLDYDHSGRFTNFSTAPRLFRQTPVYFADFSSGSIGVWRSRTNWTVNSISKLSGATKPQILKLATSSRRIVSALTNYQHHSSNYDLGIVQEQVDGSTIVFTFRFVQN